MGERRTLLDPVKEDRTRTLLFLLFPLDLIMILIDSDVHVPVRTDTGLGVDAKPSDL
jgi:hypothetical protein